MTSHVMPQDRLQQYLKERYSVVLTDDYVPVDNLIAPIFEERFGYIRDEGIEGMIEWMRRKTL